MIDPGEFGGHEWLGDATSDAGNGREAALEVGEKLSPGSMSVVGVADV